MPDLVYTQSFKKYKDEYRPELIDWVRTWAGEQADLQLFEDNSILKVTGNKAQIEGLRGQISEQFGWEPASDPRKRK